MLVYQRVYYIYNIQHLQLDSLPPPMNRKANTGDRPSWSSRNCAWNGSAHRFSARRFKNIRAQDPYMCIYVSIYVSMYIYYILNPNI